MLYTLATIAGKEFKLRLGAQEAADVEKRLGKSVLSMLLAMAPSGAIQQDIGPAYASMKNMSLPGVGEICLIIQGAMQKFQHGITLQQVSDLYDEHVDQGGSYYDFIGIIKDVLEVSGFLPKAPEAGTEPDPAKPEEPEA